jgi:hypothetical protein
MTAIRSSVLSLFEPCHISPYQSSPRHSRISYAIAYATRTHTSGKPLPFVSSRCILLIHDAPRKRALWRCYVTCSWTRTRPSSQMPSPHCARLATGPTECTSNSTQTSPRSWSQHWEKVQSESDFFLPILICPACLLIVLKMGPDIYLRLVAPVGTPEALGSGAAWGAYPRPTAARKLGSCAHHHQTFTLPHELHGKQAADRSHLQEDGTTSWCACIRSTYSL